jgi:hypothetical protein
MSELQQDDRVLLDAWAELSVYDRTATHLKERFVNRRIQVITLSLVATIASVATALVTPPELAYVAAAVAIGLPLVAAFLMNDIVQFTGTSSWIKYRYIAEMMRMHIYLYRMGADYYFGLKLEDEDDALSKNIAGVKTTINMNGVVPPTVTKPKSDAETKEAAKQANRYTKDESAWQKISDPESYLEWRLRSSRAWYESKIQTDFHNLKRYTRASQIALLVGALGSVLGSVIASVLQLSVNIQIVTLVAITNALSAYLITRSNISMTGKTYSLFQITANHLTDLERNWKALQNNIRMKDPKKRHEVVANFVNEVEKILLWEREEWYELALQNQEAVDKIIIGDLDRLNQRANNVLSSDSSLSYETNEDLQDKAS